jgi:manganese transport protein
MQGFLEFRIPLWVRRVATMAPALLVIGLGANPTRTLVLSQVVLSFALPFAVVPLVVFSSRKRLMGPLVNRPATTAVAAGIATLIVAVNIYLLWETFFGS